MTHRGSWDDQGNGRRAFWDQASHDLRQPIQSLQLLYQIVSRHAESEPVRQAADHMGRAVGDLARMHDSLIRLWRLESGGSVPEDRVVDVARLVREIVRELQALAPECRAELRIEGMEAIPEADPEWLSLILRNMLRLALVYSGKGAVSIGEDNRKGRVSIAVTFEGSEISDREASRIFIEDQGSGETRPILGPGYLGRACEVLGYRFELSGAGEGRQALRLTLTAGPRSR